jgi:hypothetical protein
MSLYRYALTTDWEQVLLIMPQRLDAIGAFAAAFSFISLELFVPL